jgi:hypothetical protein
VGWAFNAHRHAVRPATAGNILVASATREVDNAAMRAWHRRLAALFVIVIAVPAVVVAMLPRDHTVLLVATYPKSPPAAVWKLLTDHASEPAWLPAFARVTRLPDSEGRPVWQIDTPDRTAFATAMTIASVPERRYERLLLRETQPPDQPWDGRWVYELKPAGAGTELRVSEYGWTGGFIFFLQQRVIGSPDAFLRYYLRAIGAELKDEPVIEVLRSH